MNTKLVAGLGMMLGVAAAQSGLSDPSGYFRVMDIEPRTLAITLSDAASGTRPSAW